MTTTVAFATRDCLVVGCDSLATTLKPVIDITYFRRRYFDENLELRVDADGKPILHDFHNVTNEVGVQIPTNSESNVTKLFSLEPANCALLFAGAASVGAESLSNIIDSFLSDTLISKYLKGAYTISGIVKRLAEFIGKPYHEFYQRTGFLPYMEILVAGYSKRKSKPEIHKILFNDDDGRITTEQQNEPGNELLITGGQDAEIQRLLNGIDDNSTNSFVMYMRYMLATYGEYIEKHISKLTGKDIEIPLFQDIKEMPKIDTEWVSSIGLNLPNFSEQGAINFVDFLIDTMIKSQEFSSDLPTVGGDIHIGLLTKRGGFKWISNEQYTHRGNQVQKHYTK